MDVHQKDECHFGLNSPKVCSSDETIIKIKNILKHNHKIPDLTSDFITSKEIIITAAKKETNCDSESCVLTSDFIKKKLGNSVVEKELETRFKPKGPYDNNEWLDNFNIDCVLKQNMQKYPDFCAIPFQMIDFEKKKTELATIDLPDKIKNGCKYMAVVLNTDISSGKGKHWFAIFMDFSGDPYTLEYFNSSGNLPLHQIRTWQLATKKILEKAMNIKVECIIVSPNEIQKSDSECGVFCLWFILSRLEGHSVTEFKNVNMGPSDKLMQKFRKALFRHTNNE